MPLRSYVRLPRVTGASPSRVEPETFQRLLVAAGNGYGQRFEPMMTDGAHLDPRDWTYRAWLRLGNGQRVFGRPAATAEAAVENLIAKVGKA
jgi:hypothetical protein